MTTPKTMRIRWTGSDAVNRELPAEHGDALAHGDELDVPAELGERLLASSAQWETVSERARKGGGKHGA